MKNRIVKYFRLTVSILLPVLIVAGIAYAGSLTPPSGTPAATSYTLGDIYARLTTNATATAGNHSLSTTTSPAASFYSLTDIYDAIPTIYPGDLLASSTYLGVTGTALTQQFNGTCSNPETCPSGTEFPGGSQAQGGVDDYNGNNQGHAPPPDRYATVWTTCTSGNSYCGTGDAGANAKDNATGLVWSYPCHGNGCATWDTSAPDLTNCQPNGSCNYYNNDTYYTWDNSGTDNNSLTAQQLCSSNSGWSLPTQKQLMQAYIDGSYGNLEPVGVARYYLSATTGSGDSTVVWHVVLSNGSTSGDTKSDQDNTVRCVRGS